VADRSPRGSVLILVPAGVLVVIVLAAIAVDMGVVYLGQRQLADTTAAAANDAAGAGLSDPAFYRQGSLRLDEQRVAEVVCTTLRAQGPSGIRIVGVEVAVGGRTVAVRTRALVGEVFGRALPGVPPARAVRAEAEADAAVGPALPRPSLIDFHSLSC
jgi:uncharacterized membrane protein